MINNANDNDSSGFATRMHDSTQIPDDKSNFVTNSLRNIRLGFQSMNPCEILS